MIRTILQKHCIPKKYIFSLFLLQSQSYSPDVIISPSKSLFFPLQPETSWKLFVSFITPVEQSSTQYTNNDTFCRCFRARWHFWQCALHLLLPTRTVYLHKTTWTTNGNYCRLQLNQKWKPERFQYQNLVPNLHKKKKKNLPKNLPICIYP